MKFNRLGRTGLYVSELCMGTWGFSGRNYFGGAIGTGSPVGTRVALLRLIIQ